MDEIFFENSYCDTVELCTERNRMRPGALRTCLLVIMPLYCLYLALRGYWDLFLFLAVFTLWYCFQPRFAAKTFLRRQLAYHDGQLPPVVFQFAADRVICFCGTDRFEYPYRKFTKVKVSRNLIMLMADQSIYISLHKHSFTKGSYEAFLQFLVEKCPELKLPNSIPKET